MRISRKRQVTAAALIISATSAAKDKMGVTAAALLAVLA